MSLKPTSKMVIRLNLVIIPLMVAFAVYILIFGLYNTAVKDGAKYQAMANETQFRSTTVTANRGSIYDRNGKILAQSATVYTVAIDPKGIDMIDGEAEKERQKKIIADYLSEKLGVDRAKIVEKFEKVNRRQENIATKIEKPVVDEINAYLSEQDVTSNLVFTIADTKRYYPQNELAAAVIGFTNAEGDGQYGVELQYNEYLSGVDGKIISAKDGAGQQMPYKNDKIYEAQDGNSLYLTLDMTLQHYLEKALYKAVSDFNANNRSCGIIMEAKTGAILAMATAPGFDLNDRSSLYSAVDRAKVDAVEDEEERDELYAALREKQWKNKAVSERYYPGSVFKVITGSSALEEKVISLQSTFNCGRTIWVADTPFNCWANYSHGTQDFTTAMTNSCNPAFVQIGQALGAEKFCEYFESYGLTEPTGIDLPSEATSFYVPYSRMGPVELGSSSFGQTNTITPIQMITAYAAAINGGDLVTPYVVSKIVDANGNVVRTTEPNIRRQVISDETSAEMRQVLEDVVNTKNGSNAYIKGYRIGGKSGTSQKQEENIKQGRDDLYVSSYCAFAPADDPEIIMLIMVDEPTGKDYYGSVVAAPSVAEVLSEALPYLGYYPEYTEEELEQMDITVPDVVEQSVTTASDTLTSLGLKAVVVGNGDEVVAQVPERGSAVRRNGKIILYTEDDYEEETVTVPNLSGMTLSQVNETLSAYDLNLKVSGGAAQREGALATVQNYGEGAIVTKGTVIEVVFVVKSDG